MSWILLDVLCYNLLLLLGSLVIQSQGSCLGHCITMLLLGPLCYNPLPLLGSLVIQSQGSCLGHCNTMPLLGPLCYNPLPLLGSLVIQYQGSCLVSCGTMPLLGTLYLYYNALAWILILQFAGKGHVIETYRVILSSGFFICHQGAWNSAIWQIYNSETCQIFYIMFCVYVYCGRNDYWEFLAVGKRPKV